MKTEGEKKTMMVISTDHVCAHVLRICFSEIRLACTMFEYSPVYPTGSSVSTAKARESRATRLTESLEDKTM